ncbi:hypothetical protein GCM10017687_77290 [Streptomyces echinatus]
MVVAEVIAPTPFVAAALSVGASARAHHGPAGPGRGPFGPEPAGGGHCPCHDMTDGKGAIHFSRIQIARCTAAGRFPASPTGPSRQYQHTTCVAFPPGPTWLWRGVPQSRQGTSGPRYSAIASMSQRAR